MSVALTTNVDQRLLRTTKFPPEFNSKVDMTKVNIPVIKKWVLDEIARILHTEDDIVTELIFAVIGETKYPNIKELQISLTGFLDQDAASFCKDLWKLCLSGQESPKGIPKELLEAKKLELMQERVEEEKVREEAAKRQEAEHERERQLARTRDQERSERSGGQRGRYGRDYDRRRSRSPPPRHRRDDDRFYRAPPRAFDTYAPPRDDRPRRQHSPSPSRPHPSRRRPRHYSSSSGSYRSPPPHRRRPSSRDRSRSRDRMHGSRRDGYGRRRSRSPSPRRRSNSPKRYRRRSPSTSHRSRSPPRMRTRRPSYSGALGSHPPASLRTPSVQRSSNASPGRGDLIPHGAGTKDSYYLDNRRLSRGTSSDSATAVGEAHESDGSSHSTNTPNLRRGSELYEKSMGDKEVGSDS